MKKFGTGRRSRWDSGRRRRDLGEAFSLKLIEVFFFFAHQMDVACTLASFNFVPLSRIKAICTVHRIPTLCCTPARIVCTLAVFNHAAMIASAENLIWGSIIMNLFPIEQKALKMERKK